MLTVNSLRVLRRWIEVFRINLKDKEVSRSFSTTENAIFPGRLSITIDGDYLSLQCYGSKHAQASSLLIVVDFVNDHILFVKIPYVHIIFPQVSGFQKHPLFAH